MLYGQRKIGEESGILIVGDGLPGEPKEILGMWQHARAPLLPGGLVALCNQFVLIFAGILYF